MAKRFVKPTIKWSDFDKIVPPEQKAQFLAFKGRSDAYLQRVLANPETPPKIDWEAYKKTVPVKGLVDKLKSAYEAFKVPYPKDTLSAEVDKQWTDLQPKIKTFCDEQNATIAMATKELSRINALPPFDTITLEMFYDLYPEQALDPVKNPTFWPHTEDEQLGYVPPELQAKK